MGKKKTLVLLIMTTLILSITIFLINNLAIFQFDSWIYENTAKYINPVLTSIMIFITSSGGTYALIALSLSLFVFKETRKKLALPVACTVAVSAISNFLLKLVFARDRPDILRLIDEDNYSFPSGHAMTNMAFYAILLLLTLKYVENKKIKWLVSIVCVVMPILIGFSRVYLGVHYASDVIAGWFFGLAVAVIIYSIFDRKIKRY